MRKYVVVRRFLLRRLHRLNVTARFEAGDTVVRRSEGRTLPVMPTGNTSEFKKTEDMPPLRQISRRLNEDSKTVQCCPTTV